MIPLWIYLGWVLTSVKRCANTAYIATDKKIYFSKGIFYKQNSVLLSDITNITFNQGVINRIYGVGDIKLRTMITEKYDGSTNEIYDHIPIKNIPDFRAVYKELWKITKETQKEKDN